MATQRNFQLPGAACLGRVLGEDGGGLSNNRGTPEFGSEGEQENS